MLEGKVLITGGAGTLGKAIIKKAIDWPCDITIYSTDAMKHALIRKEFPHVRSVIGDIRSPDALYNAVAGHDIVIHGAAVKHIPVSEQNCMDTYDINVNGSINVALACVQLGVKECIAISTDKACHAANAYGSTKYMMEKVIQEISRNQEVTNFHLVRYGNVLESTGSVIEIWKNLIAQGKPIGITDPNMTRFWLSPSQAVDYVLLSLMDEYDTVTIPKMKSLSIGKLAEYTVGEAEVVRLSLRPGEKIHETLLTKDELRHAEDMGGYFRLWPSVMPEIEPREVEEPYTSYNAPEMTKEELLELLEE